MENEKKKKILTLTLVLVLIIAFVGGVWYLSKKISKVAVGASCSTKKNCKSGICVDKKCTEGKKDDVCRNYTDCNNGLYCKESLCATLPDSAKYFDKVVLSKKDSTTETTTFNTTDIAKINFTGVKEAVTGAYFIELVRNDNREIALTTRHLDETKLEGKDAETTIDLSRIEAGKYDLVVYLNNELVYTTPITIN